MAEALVITSGKGGVGKTTTTANLGVALALEGHSVVLVDADIGLRNLDLALGLENRIVYDLLDVVSGACLMRQALIKDQRYPGLWLLPAAQTHNKAAVAPEQMEALVGKLKAEFEFVLVDCPAGIEQGFKNAVAGADRAILVTVPEVSAIRDACRVRALLDETLVPVAGMVLNRYRRKMARRGDTMDIDEANALLGVDLLGVVPEDEAVVRMGNLGEPLAAEKNAAGQAYRQIARRIVGEEGMTEARRGFTGVVRGLFGRKAAAQ